MTERLTTRERGKGWGEGIHYSSFQGILTANLGMRPVPVKPDPNDNWHTKKSTCLWRTNIDLLPSDDLRTKAVSKERRAH
jgi:hypothetical protein